MNKDRRQELVNHIGAFLVFGIILGSGFLLIKYADTGEAVSIVHPEVAEKEVDVEKEAVKININTASQAELEKLDGIGPKTAEKIIIYREENGSFTSIEGIMDVSGIAEGKFSNIEGDIEI